MRLGLSRNVFPFSVDLGDIFNSLKIESNTTIKNYIGHDVLLINERHIVIEGNSLFEILTAILSEIILWTQNKKHCKLYKIIRRDLGFIVVALCFLQKEKLFNFDKVEHWIRIVSRYWWETSPVVAYVGSWKKRIAVVGNVF